MQFYFVIVLYSLMCFISCSEPHYSANNIIYRIEREIDSTNLKLHRIAEPSPQNIRSIDSTFHLSKTLSYSKGTAEALVNILKNNNRRIYSSIIPFLADNDSLINVLLEDVESAELLYELGYAESKMDNLGKSIKYFLQAELIEIENKDSELLAKIYTQIATIYGRLGNDFKDMIYLSKAIDISKRNKYNKTLAVNYHNLAVAHDTIKTDETLKLLHNAEAINRELGFDENWLNNVSALLYTYIVKGDDFKSAERLFDANKNTIEVI